MVFAAGGSNPRPNTWCTVIGDVVAGKYKLVEQLGHGGMGVVYSAEVLDSGQVVAVKLLHEKYDDERSTARFEREAKVGAAIDSPYVIRVYDTGNDSETGRPYMAMELLTGEELGDVFKRTETLRASVIARIAAQALSGLQAAHAAGVIHRDIKPANLFMDHNGDGTVTVKLLDFGIAKFRPVGEMSHETKGLTQTGTMMGSPLYMSPEQALGLKDIDLRTDLWSLGIVLYQGLTGQTPYDDADTLGQLIIDICGYAPDPVQYIAPWVEPKVCDVEERALLLNKADRYESAEEMLLAVRELVGDDWTLTADDVAGVSMEVKKEVATPSRESRKRFAATTADSVRGNQPSGEPKVYIQPATDTSANTIPGLANTEAGAPISRNRMYVAAAGMVVVSVIVGGAMVMNRAPAPPTVMQPPTSNAGSKTVRITFSTKPKSVDVVLDGKTIGTSDVPIELPRGDKEIKLTLMLDGFVARTLNLTPNADSKLVIELQPVILPTATPTSSAAEATKTPKQAPTGAPPAPPKPGPAAKGKGHDDLERPW